MKDAVVVDCVRTPIGRSHAERGYYRDVRSDDLAVACFQALLDRTKLAPTEIEDVILGCSKPTHEQGGNIARIVALIAGLPPETAGVTVNRLCGSSLQALNQATHSIRAGAEETFLVGGLEHMHHLPIGSDVDLNPKLFRNTSRAALHMGLTAEFLAAEYKIARQDQDAFACQSHQRAADAQSAGLFDREIVRVHGRLEDGRRELLDRDQCVRATTSLEALAALKPVFQPDGGTVTAGNSSPVNDGASAMLVTSDVKARQLELKPMVQIRATAVCGVEPCMMGLGPVHATRKVLQRAGLSLNEIDLIELNEAFAAQALACMQALELDQERVNVRGGAIALGHPLGASGTRIATTLIHAMIDQQAQFGLATMCIGLGQGIATVFENIT